MVRKIEYLIKRKEAFAMVLVLSLLSNTLLLGSAYASSNGIEIPTYMVTTRGSTGYPVPVNGSAYPDNYNFSNIDTLLQTCPPEIAIFVHGWNATSDKAREQLGRVKMSLENNKYYNTHLIGYSWKSDIGWNDSKVLANKEGAILAQLITRLIQECNGNNENNMAIRLLGHSLGSRVILSSLCALDNITSSSDGFKQIQSVHLMGAAVDDEEVSKNQSDIDHSLFDDEIVYGNAIERNVVTFTNLYSLEDDMLERRDEIENEADVYPYFEKDDALGSLSIQQAFRDEIDHLPSNFKEKNVTDEILTIEDADAGAIIEEKGSECDVRKYNSTWSLTCTISPTDKGDNHLGYMGFRDSINSSRLIANDGDGAINIVVSDWLQTRRY